jgi:hypothetical protein
MYQKWEQHTSIDRSKLRFAEEVQVAFDFLTTDHNFRCVSVEPTFVRYESDRVFINIYHGRSSYELGTEIGLLNAAEGTGQSYPLSALIDLVDSEEGNRYRNFIATTPDLVKVGVKKLSETFKKYAEDILRGNPAVFAKLKKQSDQWRKSFAREVLASHVRPKAEEAFRSKNYKEATQLYESILSELTPAELKKLEYARKHSN